ncbi:MAG: glycoside hydrolase family 5 protein [candidate division KSB1 bacterium]|nr:glycoside hydrolase family 5 protein [candidate division KSB1 bacterium]
MTKVFLFFLTTLSLIVGCGRENKPAVAPTEEAPRPLFRTEGTRLLKNECEWEFRGTNKMSVFGIDFSEPAAWSMDIVRECIDMRLTSDETLQSIVAEVRRFGMVVILTAFWYDNDALPGGTTPYPQCQLLGAVPSQDPRFNAVQTRRRQIAALFKNQTDVWFGVWNEPYDWRKETTADAEQWLKDARLMVDNIRNVGADNIIVLCGNAMGQGHEPFLEKGAELLSGRKNIVFDIHAYRTYWDIPRSEIEKRLKALKESNIAPVIIGEFAANGDHPYLPIMDACRSTRTSLLAWLWGQYKEPFKSKYRSYCREPRNSGCPN